MKTFVLSLFFIASLTWHLAAQERTGIVPPPAASQAEVNAGVLANKFVSPKTFAGSGGKIEVIHSDKSTTTYYTNNSSDVAWGDTLTKALTNLVAGDKISVPVGNFLMHTMAINLVGGCTYNWNGSRLYIDSTSTSTASPDILMTNILLYSTANNVTFTGNLILDGNNVASAFTGYIKLGLNTGKAGICINLGAERNEFTGLICSNWTGDGVWIVGGSGSPSQGKEAGRVLNSFFTGNGVGLYAGGGYWQFSNLTATGNGNGFFMDAANTYWQNCCGDLNSNGLYIDPINNNSNGLHSTWIGGSLNHNTSSPLVSSTNFARTVPAGGITFIGTHAYVGTMYLGGNGITWIGGSLGCTISPTVSGGIYGMNLFEGVEFPQQSEQTLLSGWSAADRTNLVFFNCRTLTNSFPNDVLSVSPPASLQATNSPVNGYALRYTNGTFFWAP